MTVPVAKSARRVLDAGMSEDALLSAIVEAALLLGWRVHHDRRSDRALQQGTPGFPDLVLAKDGRLIFAELKSERGHLTTDQYGWQLALEGGIDFDYFVVRPRDLDDFLLRLR